MRKRSLPPPVKFTLKDALQILMGFVMVPIGAVILGRTWLEGAPAPAILIGGAFIAFGLYRIFFAWGRLRWYMRLRGAIKRE